jgi:hypothetical protein
MGKGSNGRAGKPQKNQSRKTPFFAGFGKLNAKNVVERTIKVETCFTGVP